METVHLSQLSETIREDKWCLSRCLVSIKENKIVAFQSVGWYSLWGKLIFLMYSQKALFSAKVWENSSVKTGQQQHQKWLFKTWPNLTHCRVNPLQCSCLENPRDGGAWWAAVYGVTQSQTRLKRLSSSSSTVNNTAGNNKVHFDDKASVKCDSFNYFDYLFSSVVAHHNHLWIFYNSDKCLIPPQLLIQKCQERSKYERFLKVLYVILRCGISRLRTTDPMGVGSINKKRGIWG